LGTASWDGIMHGGGMLTGRNPIARAWGHNTLLVPNDADVPLPACYCGRSGCIETYLSGPGLERDHERRTGQQLSAREVAELEGEALDRYLERLARALAGVKIGRASCREGVQSGRRRGE